MVTQQVTLRAQRKTRFGTIFFFASRSVAINRIVLRDLCVDPRAETMLSSQLKNILLNSNFWEVLDEFFNLLKPSGLWLHKIESDEPQTSSRCRAFSEIRKYIKDMVPNSKFLANDYASLNLTAASMSPFMWWKACCVEKSLRAVTLKLLSLPAN